MTTWIALAIAGCGQEQPKSEPTTAPPQQAAVKAPSGTQVQEKPPLQQKLEQALRCSTPPRPIEIVKTLQAAKVIDKESSDGIDSISYFPTNQPFEVWGLKVTHVHGFDFDQNVFWRGPGTPPLITIGVVVPYTKEEVKKRLKQEGITTATIENSVIDHLSNEKLKSPFTEIMCQEHQ